MFPYLLWVEILEQHFFQGMCCFFCFRFFFWFMLLFFFIFFMFVSCWIPVFMCLPPWDSHCFHISPLEFMFSLSLSLFSLVFGSCTAEPLGTRTCRSVHTKTLADDPQVWHETNENGSKDDNEIGGNHITIKINKTIQMTRSSLWLIRSQIRISKYMVMSAKPGRERGKKMQIIDR